ncbi:MAG: signal transduction protein [Methanosarcinales archaeon]|nr:signal transduction protein [Methanosarcinales archaeon]
MNFTLDDTDNSLLTTGVAGLDVQLGGGIPAGTTLLVLAESGTGAEIFTKQFLYGGLENGEDGYYFSSDHSIPEIREDMKQFGWDVEKYEHTGKANFIDAYNSRFFNVLPSELRNKISAKDFLKQGMDPFNQLKSSLIQNHGTKYRMVIDSISYFLRAYDMNSVIEVIELMSSIGKLSGGLHLILAVKGLHDDLTINTMKHMADGVIELYVKDRASQIERGLVVRKMRGLIVPNRSISFDITPKGIELETTTRVL